MMALTAVVASAQNAKEPAPYGIKSGIVTMSMDMMGQAIVQQIYFDDYGRKTASVSDFGGMKSRMVMVKGEQIMVNDEAKTATRMPGFGGMGGPRQDINWLNLTDDVKKKNNIKELGEETVAGKTCKKYSLTVDAMGQSSTQTVWIYKGITLKTSSDSPMGTMVQAATKIEENATVPASMFTIPEGVKIQDFDMSMMGGF